MQAAPAASPCAITPKVAKLGQVAPNSTTPTTFTLTNTGSTPLTVKKVTPSCKCTGISNIVGQTIAPGATLELKASLKAPPAPGAKDAKVFIDFENVPGTAIAMMDADVVMPILASPPYVDALKDVTSGTISLKSADGKPFSIITAGGVPPSFVGFNAATDSPRAEYTISWNLAGVAQPPIWWTLETDRADCPLVPLRVRHDLTGSRWDMERYQREWMQKDAIVLGGLMQPGQPIEVTIEIEHYNPRGKGAVVNESWGKVKSIQTGNPNLVAEILEVKPVGADTVEVKVRMTAKEGAHGLLATSMMLTSATGSGPIPFFARVAPSAKPAAPVAPATTAPAKTK